MTYADALRARFPTLDPCVDDLFLLEAHQVEQLIDRAPARDLAAVLHASPRLRRFLFIRHPPIDDQLREVLAAHPPVEGQELDACEQRLVWEIADWIVYQRAPELYAERCEFDHGLSAITDVIALGGKVVIDAGAGTGEMTMAVADRADAVFAVEPVATLRRYLRARAGAHHNVFVVDGSLDAIPLPAATADVLLTRQAIGWRLDAELREIGRVLRPDGAAVHLTGLPYPPPDDDDELHRDLLAAGYELGSYREGQASKRRYWRSFTPARDAR